ncbi:unnamed protein product [Boreogadus saida]
MWWIILRFMGTSGSKQRVNPWPGGQRAPGGANALPQDLASRERPAPQSHARVVTAGGPEGVPPRQEGSMFTDLPDVRNKKAAHPENKVPGPVTEKTGRRGRDLLPDLQTAGGEQHKNTTTRWILRPMYGLIPPTEKFIKWCSPLGESATGALNLFGC